MAKHAWEGERRRSPFQSVTTMAIATYSRHDRRVCVGTELLARLEIYIVTAATMKLASVAAKPPRITMAHQSFWCENLPDNAALVVCTTLLAILV